MNHLDTETYRRIYPEYINASIGAYPKDISLSTGYSTPHYVCFGIFAVAVLLASFTLIVRGNPTALLFTLMSFPGIFGYIYISRCLSFLQLQESMCSTVGTVIMVVPICYSIVVLLSSILIMTDR